MVMIAISMTSTAGQSFFNFILRVVGTIAATIGAYIIWYIVDGKKPGVIVFLWLWMYVIEPCSRQCHAHLSSISLKFMAICRLTRCSQLLGVLCGIEISKVCYCRHTQSGNGGLDYWIRATSENHWRCPLDSERTTCISNI